MTQRDVRDTSVHSLPQALRNRKFKAGELICKAEPFAHVIGAQANGMFCDWCAKPPTVSRLLKCGSCKYEHYCNKKCQKKAWAYHKFECPLLKAISPKIPPDSVRLMTKILWKLSRKVTTVENDPGWREWNDLCPQIKVIERDAQRKGALLKVMITINAYVGTDKLIENGMKCGEEMIPELGRLSFNGYTLTSMGTQEIGAGLYLSPSVFNHSCAPNAVHICDGTALTVRAIRDIDTSQEPVFVNYVDPMTPKAERQAILLDDYCFTCQCTKCTNEENEAILESTICPDCGGQVLNVLILNDDEKIMKCSQCKHEFTDGMAYFQAVENCVKEGAKLVKHAIENDFVGPKELKKYLSKGEKVLSDVNCTISLAKSTLYATLSERGQEKEAYELGEQITRLLKLYYPEGYSAHGLHQWKQARLAWNLDMYDAALKHYELAHQQMVITHGAEHSMTQTVLSDVEECRRDSIVHERFKAMQAS